jgi:polyisoprenoid-binding protein YceI
MSTTETKTIAPAGTWGLDPVHSSVGFAVAYMAGTFRGTFREVSGALESTGETARLEGVAKVASVDVKDENLTAHLQGPDFFDAELNPELRFNGDVTRDGAGDAVTVRGEITIKGSTKPLEATGTIAGPMTDAFGGQRVSLTLTAKVDRTDFGVSWNAPLPTGGEALANDVTITADLIFSQAG